MRPLAQLQATLDAMVARIEALEMENDALFERVCTLEGKRQAEVARRDRSSARLYLLAQATGEAAGLDVDIIRSVNRYGPVAQARQVIALLAAELTPVTSNDIARFLGRERATVESIIRQARKRRGQGDDDFLAVLKDTRRIYQRLLEGGAQPALHGIAIPERQGESIGEPVESG